MGNHPMTNLPLDEHRQQASLTSRLLKEFEFDQDVLPRLVTSVQRGVLKRLDTISKARGKRALAHSLEMRQMRKRWG
jgi:hypothetical protein